MPEDFVRPSFHPVEWRDDAIVILDQRRLPGETVHLTATNYREVIDAIRTLAVRGAPLIGIAAAYAVALAERQGADLPAAARELIAARPTAVNLRWAVERVISADDRLAEARQIHDDQIAADASIGAQGAELMPAGGTVLTHCNTGTLATGGIGTALGVIKTAHHRGRGLSVLVDETRPLLQGARLTAWELQRDGIPFNMIVDSAAPGLIRRGDIQAVITGADRIGANGDSANKVGTYGLALAASAHDVPFFIAAPVSTIDPTAPDGNAIHIEERDGSEVLTFAGMRTAPDGASAINPAFDVTPAHLITGIITERGVLRPPYGAAIADVTRELVTR